MLKNLIYIQIILPWHEPWLGDKSDNIEGVGGLGLKTIAKRFPMLKEPQQVTIDDLFEHAKLKEQETNIKAYSKVLEKNDVIEENYKMMQLYAPILSIDAKKSIRETIERPRFVF